MASDITWSRETRKLSQLIPWEHNPRQTRKDQAERMIDSLDIFGQVQTIAIGPGDSIYDGHQRKFVWSAAEQFGPDYEVDVRVSSRELTERERQQLVVYLHRGATGSWDFDTLANGFDVGDLLEWGFEEVELGLAGFDLGNGPEDPGPQIDKAAELQEKWQVERGQVWQAGRHRLMCGDSTVAGDVGKLMGGEKAGAVITDPPYGCTDLEWDRYPTNEDVAQWMNVTNGAIVAFGAAPPRCLFAMLSLSPQPERVYVWWNTFTLTHSEDSFWQWQPIYVWRRDKVRGLDRDVIQMAANTGGDPKTHETQKPTALIRLLLDATKAESIADLFLGSGTTLVACEQTGRIGYGMEIEPKYCAVTLERLAGMGLEPELVE